MNGREVARLVVGVVALAILLTIIIVSAALISRIVGTRVIMPETLYRVMPFGGETMYVCLGEVEFINKKVACHERDGTSWTIDHDTSVLVEVVR